MESISPSDADLHTNLDQSGLALVNLDGGGSPTTPSGLEPLKKILQTKTKWKRRTMEDIFTPLKWSQYITYTVNEEENLPSDICIYRSLKALLKTEIINFSVDKSKILVKAQTEAQSKLLLETTKLGNKNVVATDINQYNHKTGTMLLDRLRLGVDESDTFIAEAIKEILTDQKQLVSSVQIFERKSFKTKQIMKVARIVFNQQTIPTYMKMGNKRITIQEEIPRPMQCKGCLRFGHTKKRCRCDYVRCNKCGSKEHLNEECTETECCVNCSGTHQAFARVCSHFQYHQEVLVRSLRYGISIRDAKQDMREEGRFLSQPLFSDVLKPDASKKDQALKGKSESPDTNRIQPTPEIPITNIFTDLIDECVNEDQEHESQTPPKSNPPSKNIKDRTKSIPCNLDQIEKELEKMDGQSSSVKRNRSSDLSDEEALSPSNKSKAPSSKCCKKTQSPNSSQETIVYAKTQPKLRSRPENEIPINEKGQKLAKTVTQKTIQTKPKSLIHDYPTPGISGHGKLETPNPSKTPGPLQKKEGVDPKGKATPNQRVKSTPKEHPRGVTPKVDKKR